MATTKLSTNIVNQPDLLRYLHQNFTLKEMYSAPDTLYKTFQINGRDLPNDDTEIILFFQIDLNNKITSRWIESTTN